MPLIILIIILVWWAYIGHQIDIKWKKQIELREKEKEELIRENVIKENNNTQNSIASPILTKKEVQSNWIRNSILTFLGIAILIVFIWYVLLFVLVSILATM